MPITVGTTKQVLANWTAAAVKNAINTARTAAGLEVLAAWHSEVPVIPMDPQGWEEWLRQVPTPFGLVLLDDTTEEQRVASGYHLRTVTVLVVIGLASADTFARQAALADTEDSTVAGVETALAASYFTTKTTYPLATYTGSIYVPFEEMRGDSEVGLCVTQWEIVTDREDGTA